jgi:WD40 repeat protein
MDSTAKLWDVTRGVEVASLAGHTAEIVSLNFNTAGDRIITGSFDHTTKVWDTATGRCLHTLAGHRGEISSTQFDFSGELCISGSIDRTCKIWNVQSGQCISTLRGHNDEILDVAFNATGTRLVTASADGTARVYNTMTGACQAILIGHEGEISKVSFNPQGNKIITASRRSLRHPSLRCASPSLRFALPWHPEPTVSIPTTGAATEPAECGTWRPAIACRSSRATQTKSSRRPSTTRATPSSRALRRALERATA